MKSMNLRIFIRVLIMLSLACASSAHAINRNDVFSEIEKLNTSWSDISVKLWINDFENERYPGVLVGDRLTYRVEADRPAYFVLILVDSKGNTAVLKPDASAINGLSVATESLTFPAAGDADPGQSIIEQAEPLGKETIYVLASDQQFPASLFELESLANYVDYGTDVGDIRALVNRVNAYSGSVKQAFSRYEYFVDSDTQFTTRGIRREISDRISEVETSDELVDVAQEDVIASLTPVRSSPIVINDINFEYDSDVLTSTGRSQLEVLGSELIDRLEQDELPTVRLTGHTDSSGPSAYNMDLSKRRSLASKRFLVDELGLPSQSIDTHGMGESAPIEVNETGNGRAKNRRVEFEIVQ